MRYAVGDVHGYRDELRRALQDKGLLDRAGGWSGGRAEVWFLGDLLDRGPDGVGVIEDVMRWQREAAGDGGYVGSVLGNHEVLALGFRSFRDEALPGDAPHGSRSFAMSWLVNGGQPRDQELLTDEMADWLRNLPPVVQLGDDLLVHSDTTTYLHWGHDVETINTTVEAVLHAGDLEPFWHLWASMTARHGFLGTDGPARARRLLDVSGAARVVHGHSIIGDLRGVPSSSVAQAWSYADGLALAADGGIYDGGPCLVVPLG